MTMDRPKATFVSQSDESFYARRANRVVVRHNLGRVVAVIEIVSPGNKDGERPFRQFVEKVADYLTKGVHVLVVDLFPPSPRDPEGIHAAIWSLLNSQSFQLPNRTDRTLASYEAGSVETAYVEPIAVGEVMPDMPLFLIEGGHVKIPLERTYSQSWNDTPAIVREAVTMGVMPTFDE